MSDNMLSNRLWIFLLIGSVLINGVLLGVVLNRSFEPKPQFRIASQAPANIGRFNPREFLMALPEEDREAARDRLRQGRGEMRDLMLEIMRSREQVWTLINADDFDGDAVRQAMMDARAARAALEAHGETIVLELVADLEPEERQAVLSAAYSPTSPRDGRPPRFERRRQDTP